MPNVPLCRPCSLITQIFEYDCPVESIECPIYPWTSDPQIGTTTGVLGKVLNNYLTNNGYELNDCLLNTLSSNWYLQLKVSGVTLVETYFFTGTTFSIPPFNAPTQVQYYNALITSLNSLKDLGYDYYLTDSETVVVYNHSCATDENNFTFNIDIGINFQIYCN